MMNNEIKEHLQVIATEYEDDRLTKFLNDKEINKDDLRIFVQEMKDSTFLSEELMSIEFTDSINDLLKILKK
ncbi:hypothetical protein NRA11_10485 [Acinetobacter baumannii]|uniref:hypothetical protein n=2 Tax=Acinetobacter baumannii TaxID=470 RepID=UPI001FD64404|nr:hypothetical protein [Acinetobacter baumannii]MDC5063922.1 hypothetical protein [Acinetobacter baumannii]